MIFEKSLLRFGPGRVQLGLRDVPRVCWVSELRSEAGRSELIFELGEASPFGSTGCAALCWVRWNSQHSKKMVSLSLRVERLNSRSQKTFRT